MMTVITMVAMLITMLMLKLSNLITMVILKSSNLKASYCSPEGYFRDPAINAVILLKKMRY